MGCSNVRRYLRNQSSSSCNKIRMIFLARDICNSSNAESVAASSSTVNVHADWLPVQPPDQLANKYVLDGADVKVS